METIHLSPFATFSNQSAGRIVFEEQCSIRTPFQRDRDRIIHCESYRRLMNKTQVFLSPTNDYYRTRLTHTQEVNQIARTIARALCLNEDLTEAIALGHDLGHTPFGHAGETALNDVASFHFRHNIQSVRVVNYIEKSGKGLNLTKEVLNGIACHCTCVADPSTLEGMVVRFSDKIAYMNHDIDDAVKAGLLSEDQIPWEIKINVGRTKSERITTFIQSIIKNSTEKIQMDPPTYKLYHLLRDFMFEAVYTNAIAKSEEDKAIEIVKQLFSYYMKNIDKLPTFYKNIAQVHGLETAVCDYVSGMSDRFAIHAYQSIFIPKSWDF